MPNKYWDNAWAQLQEEQFVRSGVQKSEWKAAGRATKNYPNKEDGDWWTINGEKMVDRWIEWRTGQNGWTIWDNDGIPAIELNVNPVWDGIPVQMHIDRVMVNPDGELIVVDLKTGARTPASALQLAFYAAGMETMLGVRPKWGTYWMAREGITSELIDLDRFPTEYVIDIVKQFDKARKESIFVPNFSHCVMCSLKTECKYKEGKQ